MGSISSGVGLVSGLDHESLITQLMQVERRTLDQIKSRMTGLDSQKAALLDISARVSGLLSRVQALMSPSSFRGAKATSSNSDALSATARSGAAPGSYQFIVRALASTQHNISRGYASSSAALAPGTLTIESAAARVNRDTDLSALNGSAGVQRGSIRIHNRAGASATVDLTDVVSLNEVLERINASGIGVTASISGDGLRLADTTAGASVFRVDEVAGGQTAADLGFNVTRASDTDGDGQLNGAALATLSTLSSLSALNDGLGVRRSVAGGDFSIQTATGAIAIDLSDIVKPETRLGRLNHGAGVALGVVRITARDGTVANVDLSGAKTIADVETALEAAFGGGRIGVALTGSRLVLSDSSTVPEGQTAQTFSIADVSGHAARDLGLDVAASDGKIDGRNVLRVESLADALAAINEAAGNVDASGNRRVTAALAADGQRIVLTAAQGEISLVPGTGQALRDLGLDQTSSGAQLDGRRIIGGLNTSLLRTLNGGNGLSEGIIRITADSNEFTVDLTNADTLDAAIERIRSTSALAGVALNISYDSTGTRLSISRTTGGTLSIDDESGEFAKSLGINKTGPVIRSENVQRQYVGETTSLSSIANGRGVTLGTIRITNASGVAKTVDLAALGATSVGDVIEAINDLDIGVEARINHTGDGIQLRDTTSGAVAFKVEDVSGTAARDLNLLGAGVNGVIDGSFEYQISISGTDTLASLAARISEKTALAQATLLNDGNPAAPYRLSLVSRASGRAGALLIDDGGAGLGFSTLTSGRDARVLFGGADGLLLTRSSNTFSDTVDGLTITANHVSDQPVTVTVEANIDAAVEAMRAFVDGFNDTITRIKNVSNYDSETETRGVLLGDATLRTVESRLFRQLSRAYVGTNTAYSRLSQFGVKLGNESELSFDEAAFRAAIAADPEGATKFFSDTANGAGARMKKDLEAIANSDGLIQSRTGTLDGQRKLLEERTKYMETILSAKETRLRREFTAMELALSQLQSQQSSLTQLAALSSSGGSGG